MREAWEETGFDIKAAGLVKDPKKVRFVEKTLRDQSVKLFIFRGVPLDYNFIPQTRKEISKCEWYKIADLPTSVKAKHIHQEGSGQHLVVNANKFYMVAPFVQELKKIISQLRKGDHRQSSKLAAPPTNIETINAQSIVDSIQIPTLEAPTVMSPAVPSSLPEVTPLSAQEQSLRLKQQLDIGVSSQPEKSNTVMSNALLSMLRGAPVAEMRNDPHTPLEHPAFSQSRSPETSAYPVSANIQSPPSFEMQQASQPPPLSSTDQQLNQHARSLLETFSKSKAQSPAVEARQQLAPSKQDLLAAFMSKPRTPSNIQTGPATNTNHGNNLLQMLKRNTSVSEAGTQTNLLEEPVAPPIQEVPVSKVTAQPSQPRPNPLLDLLKGSGPAAPLPVSAEVPATPLAEGPKQAEPAELSATSDHENKPANTEAVKADILSMLGNMPPKTARAVEKEKSRKGSTAANLSGPIVQPQFDAIKAPVSEDDMKRPTTSQRKLFDPRNDDFRPPPIKVISKNEDRNRQKSPRVARQHKTAHSGRPVTPKEPKEAPKPFQPQILKRPQAAESEVPPFVALSNAGIAADGLARTMTTQSPDQNFVTAAASKVQPYLPAETPVLPLSPTKPAAPVAPVSSMPPVPQDPQREALLSLLRTPNQTQAQTQPKPQKAVSPIIDLDSTPHPVTTSFTAEPQAIQTTIPDGPSPPATFFPSQIVSPINEMDPLAPRSRVSSLASIGNGLVIGGGREGSLPSSRPQTEKRQTPAGDKAFLMNYLRGFASQGQDTT